MLAFEALLTATQNISPTVPLTEIFSADLSIYPTQQLLDSYDMDYQDLFPDKCSTQVV